MNTRCQRMVRRVKSRDGFTLIEMLIVIIILGILAMVIVPQITVSQDDAKVSAAKQNLSTLRGAIGMYYSQHNNTYPAAANFITAMTRFSNLNGATSNTGDATYNFGPYLKDGIPANPFSSVNANLVNTANATGNLAAPRTPAGTEGYQYWATLGVVFLNDDGASGGVNHEDF